VLAIRPTLDGSAYFNRYALNAQVIVDDTCRIRFFYLGFPGSVHDARAYGACYLATQSEHFFRGDEYILADSAYALTPTVIPTSRGSAAQRSERAGERSVQPSPLHGPCRSGAYHWPAEGSLWLAAWFARLDWICDKKSHEKAMRWVEACFVLHNNNMLLDVREAEWNEDLDTDVASGGSAPPLRPVEVSTATRVLEEACY
jgi:DDE superfamily endonuclease